MNARKLLLIVVVFGVACAGWQILKSTLTRRTRAAQSELGADVERMFGPRLEQRAPSVHREEEEGPPARSEIRVSFEHENRYRGLIWFSVYKVRFDATYWIEPGADRFAMSLPEDASIDAFHATANGKEMEVRPGGIAVELDPEAEAPIEVRVAYAASGQDRWEYDLEDRSLRDFRLTAETNFDEIDYPSHGLSPTEMAKANEEGGRTAVWQYSHMLPARNRVVGIVMPSMPASGELSARIAEFAPVSLFFFLTVMVTIQILRNLKLHPINYLLIAAGFFAFHILLAYLVDHLTIHVSFWVSAAVSVLLVVSYLRLVLGLKTAIGVPGAAQMVYLVFFSYAFFWQGWTGLTVVIGAVVTLFLIMQLTGRVEWDAKFPDLQSRRTRAPDTAAL
ncbi:MAG: inner membrane CreD family protein [Planctomycetota bacterium]